MAKFVYRMQNILDIKNKLEIQAKNSYAVARMRLNKEEEKLDGLFAQKKAYEDAYRQQLSGSIDVRQINICKNAIELSKNMIKKQLVEVKVASLNLEAAQKRLGEIMKERKIQEKLREKAYEEAYASIFLDNGEEIHRKVHTLKENGTDTDVVAASGKKAKDIVGLKKDNNKWDNILLPHAKIDSFISASKPEERYIEWFNSTPELNEERKYFERIGKDISVIDKTLIEIKKEIARLENERKKLEKSESNFKNIQKLISAFNKRSETILPNITSLSTETEYDELLNEVKKIIRDYNRQLNILKDHLIFYNELKTLGFKEYKKRLNTIKSLKERISKISSLIENKKKLEKLEREYTTSKIEL